MGLIYGTVQLSNPSSPELQGLEVRALADGHRRTVPYMGPIEVLLGAIPHGRHGSRPAAPAAVDLREPGKPQHPGEPGRRLGLS